MQYPKDWSDLPKPDPKAIKEHLRWSKDLGLLFAEQTEREWRQKPNMDKLWEMEYPTRPSYFDFLKQCKTWEEAVDECEKRGMNKQWVKNNSDSFYQLFKLSGFKPGRKRYKP